VHLETIGHVVKDAHREGRGLLEDHPYLTAQVHEVIGWDQDIFPVKQYLTSGTMALIEFINAVINPEMGGLAAAGGPIMAVTRLRATSILLSNNACWHS
jgi:hypothetical protein